MVADYIYYYIMSHSACGAYVMSYDVMGGTAVTTTILLVN